MEENDSLELGFSEISKSPLSTQGEETKSELFLQEGQGKMKDKDTVNYTRSDLPSGKTDWNKIKAMKNEEIEEAAKFDRENPRWTKKMLSSAELRMPQKKVSVHMYMDKDVVDWFKVSGKGYQSRINSVLKSYVHKHLQKHS